MGQWTLPSGRGQESLLVERGEDCESGGEEEEQEEEEEGAWAGDNRYNM